MQWDVSNEIGIGNDVKELSTGGDPSPEKTRVYSWNVLLLFEGGITF